MPRKFPGGPVVRNLPWNAEDLIPDWETKILHTAVQLSLHSTTTEPPGLELVCHSQSPFAATANALHSAACALQLLSLHATTRESMHPMKPPQRSCVLQVRHEAAK